MKGLPMLPPGRSGRIGQLRVRGHTMLCLQGFRGEGYNWEFVLNLTAIHARLSADPAQEVEVADQPDVICGACPHHDRVSGCSLNGLDSEAAIRAQDHTVLARLGMKAGDRLPWSAILMRIGRTLTGDSLTEICGQCRWLPLGYCREGVERLRAQSLDHD